MSVGNFKDKGKMKCVRKVLFHLFIFTGEKNRGNTQYSATQSQTTAPSERTTCFCDTVSAHYRVKIYCRSAVFHFMRFYRCPCWCTVYPYAHVNCCLSVCMCVCPGCKQHQCGSGGHLKHIMVYRVLCQET